jgi:hypothetical protein
MLIKDFQLVVDEGRITFNMNSGLKEESKTFTKEEL